LNTLLLQVVVRVVGLIQILMVGEVVVQVDLE
jgi:hypothetical protein